MTPRCGGADELDEVVDFAALERRVLFDLLERLRGIELRLEQVPIGGAQFLERVVG